MCGQPDCGCFFQILERQPEAHKKVAQTLRSIVRDTEALDLFADTGLPSGTGFTWEFLSRLVSGAVARAAGHP